MKSREVDVLVVEDTALDVERILRALHGQRSEITTAVAANGAVGLEYLQHHKPKVILLDLNVRDMDGMEFLKSVRMHPETASIPVIVLTSVLEDKKRVATRMLEVSGYILKTSDDQTLAEQLTVFKHLMARRPTNQRTPPAAANFSASAVGVAPHRARSRA